MLIALQFPIVMSSPLTALGFAALITVSLGFVAAKVASSLAPLPIFALILVSFVRKLTFKKTNWLWICTCVWFMKCILIYVLLGCSHNASDFMASISCFGWHSINHPLWIANRVDQWQFSGFICFNGMCREFKSIFNANAAKIHVHRFLLFIHLVDRWSFIFGHGEHIWIILSHYVGCSPQSYSWWYPHWHSATSKAWMRKRATGAIALECHTSIHSSWSKLNFHFENAQFI